MVVGGGEIDDSSMVMRQLLTVQTDKWLRQQS